MARPAATLDIVQRLQFSSQFKVPKKFNIHLYTSNADMTTLLISTTGTLPSTYQLQLRHRSQAFPAPLAGHQSLCRAPRHSQTRAINAWGLHICRAASSVRINTALSSETCVLVHVVEHPATVQVATQEAPLSTFAQQEGRILPLGSEGAWDEEALGHPVVSSHEHLCSPFIPFLLLWRATFRCALVVCAAC